ncbi:MAG: flagellar export chaperone FliS [Magnetococcales bacterium]|nr:flagellar export chaperone FliS [Magnetococcales bacterium]
METEPVLSPLEVLIQLYEGAVQFLEQSTKACEAGRVDEFKEYLGRGRRIIEEFQRTLDFEQGGAVSVQLNDLYEFMLENLTQAGLTHDAQYLHWVVGSLNTLLSGWRSAGAIAAVDSNPQAA